MKKKFKLNNYNIEQFICKDSIFKSKFEFKENKVINFRLYNSNFEDITDLYGCNFIKFDIEKSIFNDFAGFENCIFGTINKLKDEIAIFKHTTFKDSLNIRDSKFLSGLDIKNINLQGESNFLNADIEIANTNRETFRSLKHSFDSIGNIIEANIYYQKEMRKREEELKEEVKENFWDWLVFKTHGISSNHSQDWLLALFWIIVSTFLYSFFKEKSIGVFSTIGSLYIFSIFLLYVIYYLDINSKKYYISIPIIYIFYGLSTGDFILYEFSNNLNPFSIMSGKDKLNLSTLIYKVLIAYLIYQFIVSIRQNTRRK